MKTYLVILFFLFILVSCQCTKEIIDPLQGEVSVSSEAKFYETDFRMKKGQTVTISYNGTMHAVNFASNCWQHPTNPQDDYTYNLFLSISDVSPTGEGIVLGPFPHSKEYVSIDAASQKLTALKTQKYHLVLSGNVEGCMRDKKLSYKGTVKIIRKKAVN